MFKGENKLSITSVAIICIIVMLAGITMLRVSKNVFSEVVNSSSGKMVAIKNSVLGFTNKFEELFPRVSNMNAGLYLISGISKSDQVIIGADDWMFYSSSSDGNPIADYEGTNFYSDKDKDAAYNNIAEIQDYLAQKNIEFCFFVPPNKESVYYRYMPAKYHRTTETRTDALLEYLQNKGINAINPKEELLTYSEDHKTYYKYDTHWNDLGAYIGTKCILKSFGIQVPEISDDMVLEDTKMAQDLIQIANLNGIFEPDYGETTKYTLSDITEYSTRSDDELLHVNNEKANNSETIFVIGDSFGAALVNNLAYQFSNVYLIHRDLYNNKMLDEVQPDYVVLEFVERYSHDSFGFRIR